MESKEAIDRIIGITSSGGGEFIKTMRVGSVIDDLVRPLHARISELEAEVKSANERIKKVSTILVEVHGFSKNGIMYKILNP